MDTIVPVQPVIGADGGGSAAGSVGGGSGGENNSDFWKDMIHVLNNNDIPNTMNDDTSSTTIDPLLDYDYLISRGGNINNNVTNFPAISSNSNSNNNNGSNNYSHPTSTSTSTNNVPMDFDVLVGGAGSGIGAGVVTKGQQQQQQQQQQQVNLNVGEDLGCPVTQDRGIRKVMAERRRHKHKRHSSQPTFHFGETTTTTTTNKNDSSTTASTAAAAVATATASPHLGGDDSRNSFMASSSSMINCQVMREAVAKVDQTTPQQPKLISGTIGGSNFLQQVPTPQPKLQQPPRQAVGDHHLDITTTLGGGGGGGFDNNNNNNNNTAITMVYPENQNRIENAATGSSRKRTPPTSPSPKKRGHKRHSSQPVFHFGSTTDHLGGFQHLHHQQEQLPQQPVRHKPRSSSFHHQMEKDPYQQPTNTTTITSPTTPWNTTLDDSSLDPLGLYLQEHPMFTNTNTNTTNMMTHNKKRGHKRHSSQPVFHSYHTNNNDFGGGNGGNGVDFIHPTPFRGNGNGQDRKNPIPNQPETTTLLFHQDNEPLPLHPPLQKQQQQPQQHRHKRQNSQPSSLSYGMMMMEDKNNPIYNEQPVPGGGTTVTTTTTKTTSQDNNNDTTTTTTTITTHHHTRSNLTTPSPPPPPPLESVVPVAFHNTHNNSSISNNSSIFPVAEVTPMIFSNTMTPTNYNGNTTTTAATTTDGVVGGQSIVYPLDQHHNVNHHPNHHTGMNHDNNNSIIPMAMEESSSSSLPPTAAAGSPVLRQSTIPTIMPMSTMMQQEQEQQVSTGNYQTTVVPSELSNQWFHNNNNNNNMSSNEQDSRHFVVQPAPATMTASMIAMKTIQRQQQQQQQQQQVLSDNSGFHGTGNFENPVVVTSPPGTDSPRFHHDHDHNNNNSHHDTPAQTSTNTRMPMMPMMQHQRQQQEVPTSFRTTGNYVSQNDMYTETTTAVPSPPPPAITGQQPFQSNIDFMHDLPIVEETPLYSKVKTEDEKTVSDSIMATTYPEIKGGDDSVNAVANNATTASIMPAAASIPPNVPSPEPSSSSSPNDNDIWNEHFQELVEYKNLHGHCCVPTTTNHNNRKTKKTKNNNKNQVNHKKNYHALIQFVKRQRYQYRLRELGNSSTLTAERQQALDQLGFIWDLQDAIWEEKWLELIEYQKTHGICQFPSLDDPDHTELAAWIKRQQGYFLSYCSTMNSNGSSTVPHPTNGSSSSQQPQGTTTPTLTAGQYVKLAQVGFIAPDRNNKAPHTVSTTNNSNNVYQDHQDDAYNMICTPVS